MSAALHRYLDRLARVMGVRPTYESVVRLWEAAGRPGSLHLLDAGTGGWAVVSSLLRWADRTGVRIAITRLEPDPQACMRAARRFAGEPRVRVVQGDRRQLRPASADIVAALGLLRGLPPVQVPWMLLHWREAARIGVVAVEPWGFSAGDVAELRSYPGLEELRYRRRRWFCGQITLAVASPPCGRWRDGRAGR